MAVKHTSKRDGLCHYLVVYGVTVTQLPVVPSSAMLRRSIISEAINEHWMLLT